MLTSNEIKFILKKYSPGFIFYTVYKVWLYAIQPTLNYYYAATKLKGFTSKILKECSHDGLSYKIWLNPNNGTVDTEIFLHGVYEPFFLTIIKENLEAGSVFVDIGANIGQHSIFAAKVVGNTGKVISFEPIKNIYQQMLDSVSANDLDNITLYNHACGEAELESKINVSPNIGASSITHTYENGYVESIKIVPGDNLLLSETRIDFIKMDVEGYEYSALKGIESTLKKFKPKILIEFSPYYYKQSNPEDGISIFKLMKELGYNMYDVENNNKVADEAYIEYISKEFPQTNFLCVHKESRFSKK